MLATMSGGSGRGSRDCEAAAVANEWREGATHLNGTGSTAYTQLACI